MDFLKGNGLNQLLKKNWNLTLNFIVKNDE